MSEMVIKNNNFIIYHSRKPHKPEEKWPLYSRSSPHYYTYTADGTSGPAGPRGPRASACAFWNDFLNKLNGMIASCHNTFWKVAFDCMVLKPMLTVSNVLRVQSTHRRHTRLVWYINLKWCRIMKFAMNLTVESF